VSKRRVPKVVCWLLIAAFVGGPGSTWGASPASPTADGAPVPEACDLFATKVGAFDRDAGLSLTFAPFFGSLSFVDDNADGVLNANERVSFDMDASGDASGNDVRIWPAPGSHVRAVDADFGLPFSNWDGSFAFFDSNGDGIYDNDDPLYFDHDFDGVATLGDVRLTSETASLGAALEVGDADLGNVLLPLDSAILAFVDTDADAVYGNADLLILDADSSSSTDGGDVRLSGRLSQLTADPLVLDVQPPALDVVLALRAKLTAGGAPLRGEVIDFESGGTRVCAAVTGSDGVASCEATVDLAKAVAGAGYRAVFRGNSPYCGSAADGSLARVGATALP
jgi:hypothetical protein